MDEVAAQAVELPDDEHVARSERTHAAVESRAVVADAGGEVVVDVAAVDARGLQRAAPAATTLFPLVAVVGLESLFFRRQEAPLVAAEEVVVDRVPVVEEVVVRAARST